MSKICRTCKETKEENQFSIATSGKTDGNFRVKKKTFKTQCKDCDAAYARQWRKTHKNYLGTGKINKYNGKRLLASAVGTRLIEAKARIKKHGQPPTDLTKDWLISLYEKQGMRCALSNELLSLDPKQPTTLSLDKIDPSKGYTKDNVQWLAWAVNRAKGDMPTQMFLNMCRMITEKCNDYPEKE